MAERGTLVAGGAGFLGAYVTERLVRQARGPVIVVDNCSRGQEANLPDGCSLIRENILNMPTGLIEVIEKYGIDTIFDFAARVYGVRDLYKNPAELLVDNIAMTRTLLQAAAAGGIKKYVFTSSSCVYDFAGAKVPHEEDDVGICDTSYGFSKVAGEALCRWFAHQYGFETRIVRPFNVIGPRDSFVSPHVLLDFIRAAWRLREGLAKTFPMVGSGTQTRDFTWVEDAADAILAVAERGRNGRAYNVGTGREVSIRDLALMVYRSVERPPGSATSNPPKTFEHQSAPREDIQRRAASIARITNDTGWRPQVKLEDAISRVVTWLVPKLRAEVADDGAE